LTALLIALLPLAAPLAAIPVADAATATLAANPTAVVPGQTFTFTGGGFGAHEAVVLTWDGQLLSPQATTDGAGAFTGTIPGAPMTAPPGAHQFGARGTASGQTAAVTITVPSPVAAVAPASGVPGATVTASGSGFVAGEPVTVTFDGAQVVTGSTSVTGTVAASFAVPGQAANGGHTVLLRGAASGITASASFTVAAQITVAVAPASGAPGTTVTVSGNGFGASEPVTVSYDGAQVAAGVSAASGSLPGLSFGVPNPTAAGPHTIVARGSTTGRAASAVFTATTTPALTLSRNIAPPSSALTVDGSGFAAGEQVALQLDSLLLTTATADARGGFAGVTVTVPGVTGGVHTLTARGQQSGLTATTPLTVSVQTALTLAPSSAASGSTVAASASGFGSGEQVAFSVDGVALTTATAGATGAISSLPLALPSLTAGGHTVTARGATSGTTVTATLTIVPSLTASTSAAAPGGTVTLAGSGYAANERVDLLLGSTVLGNAVTDAAGSFTAVAITLPATLPAGPQTITGRGATSGSVATVVVAIAITPRLTLSRSTTIAGGLLTVSGQGLAPDEAVSLNVDGTALRSILTDDSGAFLADVVLPTTLGVGQHTVIAVEVTSGRSIQATLTIVAAQPRVSQTYHFVGSLLPHTGAPLFYVNGILTVAVEPQTGDFTGHAQLLLSDGKTVLHPVGWIQGTAMKLRAVDAGVVLNAHGAAVSANRYAGAFTRDAGEATLGFWAASVATTPAVVHYAYTAQTSSGPDAGTRTVGTLDLLGDTYGGLIGWLRLPGGVVQPVNGQLVNGNINMLIVVRSGTPLFLVGTTAGSGYRGELGGPLAGDGGTWSAVR
jgi:hypothetical protein